MADPATQQLKIQIKAVGQAGLSKLASSLRGINGIAKQSKIDFGAISKELNNTNKTMIRSANNVRRLRDAFEQQANSLDRTTKEFKEATEAAKRLDKELAKMEKRKPAGGGLRGAAQIAGTIAGAGVFGGVEGALGSAIGAFGGPAGAIVGGAIGAQVGQLRQAAGAAAEYAAALQKQRIALVGVTTSNEEYKIAIDAIRQATQDYALPQDIVTRQFTKLQASVQGAGGNIEDTKKAFDGIVAAVRATGGSLQDVDSALTATAQVFSKGKVSAEELRQQIGERLPGAFTLFAESMGKTPAELDKALEKGEVTLLDFLKFVEQNIERYKENAKAIAASPAAAGDRLKRDLGNLSESVGRLLAPIGAAFQDIFSKIAGFITRATDALARFFNMAFDQDKYERALVTIADYEALEMTGGLQTARGGGARKKAYDRAKEMVALQTSLMGGPGAGVVRPEESTGLAGTDVGVDVNGTGASARQDISLGLLRASEAAITETNEKRKVALQLEVELIKIQESGRLANEKQLAILIASNNAKNKMLQIDKKEDDRRKKAVTDYANMIQQFTLGGEKQFDLNAQRKQRTPFDAFVEGAKEFEKSLGGVMQASKELAQVGFKGISDGITELVVNGTMNFREFAASLLRDMARIIMQQIVMKSLMQAIGFGGGGIDSSSFLLSNPTQYNTSAVNIGSQGFGRASLMAKGGITQGLSIAGEAGPEAVVPLPDGRSIPVTMQGGVGNVVVNVDASGTKAEGDDAKSRRFGELLANAVKEEIIQQKRPGGLLH